MKLDWGENIRVNHICWKHPSPFFMFTLEVLEKIAAQVLALTFHICFTVEHLSQL